MNASKKGKGLSKIGDWLFDPDIGRFYKQEYKEFFLESRLKRIFNLLLENRNSIVKRQEIIDFVWKDVQVNEESLTKGIFDLRALFKAKNIHQIKIETIRNVGYRLVLEEYDKSIVLSNKTLGKRIFKASLYLIGAIAFIIMLIRAVRY